MASGEVTKTATATTEAVEARWERRLGDEGVGGIEWAGEVLLRTAVSWHTKGNGLENDEVDLRGD